MAKLIPCAPAGQSRWTQRTTLEGRDYVLTFDWNQRDGHWFLSIADQDAAPIATGVKLVTNWPLLRGVVDARRPPGELAIDDPTNSGLDPGFADLGSLFVLVYFTRAEIAA